MPADLVTRVNLDLLYPPFVEWVLELAARCRARGQDYYVTSGFRSPEEQLALWQKGRNKAGAVVKPKEIVTKVKFGAHNAGAAVDFTADKDQTKPGLQPDWADRERYRILGEEAKALGLDSGFFWAFPDAGHVQLDLSAKSITLTSLRGLHAKGGVKSMWHLLDQNGPWAS